MGARASRAAQRQRAQQEATTTALNVRAAHRSTSTAHRLRRHRSGRPARPVPLVGLYTQRKAGIDGGQTAMLEPRRARRRVLHAAGPHRRRALDRGATAGHRARSPRPTGATSPTSPTGRTSSCTGSGSRTCRRSGPSSKRSACPPPRPAVTPRGSCSAARSKGSPTTRCSTPTRAATRSSTRYVGDPRFSNLPRKFKTSISGCARHCTDHEINDVVLRRRRRPGRHGPGFDLWVGGGLSTNPMFAQRLGVFVAADEVPDVWAGVVGIFRDYGYRRLRNHARLKFLVADWGVGEVPRGAGERVPRARAARRPAPRQLPTAAATTSASTRSSTAAFYVGAATEGRPDLRHRSSAELADAGRGATAAAGCGSPPQQRLLVLDVAPERGRRAGRRAAP